MPQPLNRRRVALSALAVAALPVAGCVTVETPDKPIEINLNVAISQEVLVRMQRDVEQLINQNPQAFPQSPPARKPQ
ncbi:MAG TPA: YnbE family lipoprotein [Sphingomicrobium sp.]|nr:YnbE family lipoprotein [Sphingomicrobium sp.]